MATWTITPFGDIAGEPGGIGTLGERGFEAYAKALGGVFGGSGDRGLLVSGRRNLSREPLIQGGPRLVIAHDNEVVVTPKQQSQLRVVGDPRTFKPEQLDSFNRAVDTYGTHGQSDRPIARIQPRRDDNLNSSVVPQFDKGGLIRNAGITEKMKSPSWLKGKMTQLTLPEGAPRIPIQFSPPGSSSSSTFSTTPAFDMYQPKNDLPRFARGGAVEGKCPMCGQPLRSFGFGGSAYPAATMEFVTPGLGARNDDDVGDWMKPEIPASSAYAVATFKRGLASALNPPPPMLTV